MTERYECGQGSGDGSGCGLGINMSDYDHGYRNAIYRVNGRYAAKSHYHGYVEKVNSTAAYYISKISKSSYKHIPLNYDMHYSKGIKPLEAFVDDAHE